MSFRDSARNPFTNDIDRLYNLRSESKGGSTTNIIGVNDITIPASPNYPSTDSGASTSYIVYLDYEIYRTSTNSTYFEVRNETQGVDLTIVDAEVALSNYTCKFNPTNTNVRNAIEFHVGSTSNVAGDTISYKAQSAGGLLNAATLNSLVKGVSSVVIASTITSNYGQINADIIVKSTEDVGAVLSTNIVDLNANGGGEIIMLEGIYNALSTSIGLLDNVNIRGVGWATKIKVSSSSVIPLFSNASTLVQCKLSDLEIDGQKSSFVSAMDCILLETSSNVTFDNLYIHDFVSDGIELDSTSFNLKINNCYIDNCADAISIDQDSSGVMITNNTLINGTNGIATDTRQYGLKIDGNTIKNNTSRGVFLRDAFGARVTNNTITGNSSAGIYVFNSTSCIIANNFCYNNESGSTSQILLDTSNLNIVGFNMTSTTSTINTNIDDKGANNQKVANI